MRVHTKLNLTHLIHRDRSSLRRISSLHPAKMSISRLFINVINLDSSRTIINVAFNSICSERKGVPLILFLDFDGVLHPDYETYDLPDCQMFCRLPQLERILRDFPNVDLVISSMWRYQFTLDQLRARFSPDIALRIIGKLPLSEYFDSSYVRARREREITSWLIDAERTAESWVALDDCAWHFHLYRDHLVVCNGYTGLNDQAEALLRTIFQSESG